MDVASSLMHSFDSSPCLQYVSYQRLANMFADAGVDSNTEWIWATHIETDPIRSDGALRAALGSAIQRGLDQVVFTSFKQTGTHNFPFSLRPVANGAASPLVKDA
jgi:hypothetical protein